MNWARIAVLVLVIIEAGWLAFDGTRALIVGDFITPKSGPYAGQLGPWHHLAQLAGLDPRGTPVKVIFTVYGWTWLLVGPIDVRGLAGRYLMDYGEGHPSDISMNYGGGMGYRFTNRARVGVTVNWLRRNSDSAERTYRTRYIFAGLTWGTT